MKHYLILALALGLCCACDEEEPKQYGGTLPLDTPVITLVESEYNRLSFSWTPVEGAVDYSYKLTDAKGKLIAGDLVKTTTAEIEDLNVLTEYTLSVYAYADLHSDYTTSEAGVISANTPFYPLLDVTGEYTSAIITSSTWEPTLSETRAEGEDDHYGTFTLQNWYGYSGYNLVFNLDEKGKVKIQNGEVDSQTSWIKVLGGNSRSNKYIRNGILIDETRCAFVRDSSLLRLYTRSVADTTRVGYDTFEW